MSIVAAAARHLGIASLAGVISGFLVAGVLGRIAMRVAGFTARPELIGVETSNGNRVGEITIAGTLALALFVGVVAGIVGGVLYASAEPWLRSRPWKGPIFGAALLLGFGFTVITPNNFDFERFGSGPLNVLMFALLFVAFGASTAYLFDVIRRAIDGTGALSIGLGIVAWLAAVGAVAMAALAIFSIGGLDDPLPALLIVVAVLIPPLVRWRGLPRSVGYAGFALPVVAGGLRTLAGLIAIVD
jgi:hypothetical protein